MTIPFDPATLDPEKVVEVDLMGADLLSEWRSFASDWASKPPFYVVTYGFPQVVTGRYPDVREVLLDRDRFTAETPSGSPLALFDIFKGLPQLNAMEGESHDRLRRLLMPFFSAEGIASFEDAIAGLVADLLDRVDAQGGEFDAMADFAEPLVERTLLEVLFDTEPEQQAEFTAYSRAMPLVLQPTPEGEYQPAFVEQFERTTAMIEDLLEDRRRNPRNDLVTTLVKAKEEGFPVSHDEMVGNVLAVYAGAQLATATSVGVLLMNLAKHPEQYELVRVDRDLVPAAVDESLRVHPAGLFGFPRYALEDTEIGGTKVWEDMAIQIGLASANLDPDRFPDPLSFDIRRAPKGSLSFSLGAHQCIGSRVARMMLIETGKGVAGRYRTLSCADPAFEPKYDGVLGELKPDSIPLVAD